MSLPALIMGQLVVRSLFLFTGCFYFVMPSQYPFLNEVILLERSGPFGAVQAFDDPHPRVWVGIFLRWIGQLLLGAIFAVCVLMSVRTIGCAS